MKMKKILSSILCCVLVFTMGLSSSITAFAAGLGSSTKVLSEAVGAADVETATENDWFIIGEVDETSGNIIGTNTGGTNGGTDGSWGEGGGTDGGGGSGEWGEGEDEWGGTVGGSSDTNEGWFFQELDYEGYHIKLGRRKNYSVMYTFHIEEEKLSLDFYLKLSLSFEITSTTDNPKGFKQLEIDSGISKYSPFGGNSTLQLITRLKNVSGTGTIKGTYEGQLEAHINPDGSATSFVRTSEFNYSLIEAKDADKPLKLEIDAAGATGFAKMKFSYDDEDDEDDEDDVENEVDAEMALEAHSIITANKDEESEGVSHICNEALDSKGCTKGTIQNEIGCKIKVRCEGDSFDGEFIFDTGPQSAKLPECDFYCSHEFNNEFGYGTCPHKIKSEDLEVQANPSPGVYKYDEKGLDVSFKCNLKDAKIYYAVVDKDKSKEDLQYKQYKGEKIHLNFEPKDTMDTQVIEAYVEYGGREYQKQSLTYIMLGKGIECALLPKTIDMPVKGDATAVFIYPSHDSKKKATWSVSSGEGTFTYEKMSDYDVPGIEFVQLTGVKEGKGTLKAEFGKVSATCDVTVTDDLSLPVATYGTNLYILKEIDIATRSLTTYKDQNTEIEANAPYFYHDGKHCIGEVLGHADWDGKKTLSADDIKIYYTIDGSEPVAKVTDSCFEYTRNSKIYMSINEMLPFGVVTLKAIAYDPKTGKMSDTESWNYIILDSFPDTGQSQVIMIPETKHLSHWGIGLCLAVYIPKLSDLLNKDNWRFLKPKWMKTANDTDDTNTSNAIGKLLPCFQVEWSWWSDGWLTVPVFGTTERLTETFLGFDLIQAGLLIGLSETGKKEFVEISATGQSNSYDPTTSPGSKASGICKVYVYDEDDPDDPEIKKFTVDYDNNGGTGSIAKQTKKRGETLTLSSEKPIRTGYTFKGWSVSRNGAVKYQPGDKYRRDEDMTLYAVWERTKGTYLVKYDSNAGKETVLNLPKSQEKKAGKDLTLSKDKPSRSGYDFLGWSESKDDTSVQYKPGDVFKKDKDVTLYAKWKKTAGTYTVTYDANGGTGAPASQTKIKGEDLTLSIEMPTRAGYKFKYWSTAKDKELVIYIPGEEYTLDADLMLYAVWEKDTTKILVEYDAAGGTDAPDMEAYDKTGETTKVTISGQSPTRAGYTFSGKWWEPSLSGGTEYEQNKSYDVKDSLYLYALWTEKADTYAVEYDANGGTGAPATQEKTKDADLTLSTDKPERYGYTFQGWSEAKDATEAQYQAGGTYTKNQSVVLYAVWKKAEGQYRITYDANGGTDAPDLQVKTQGQVINLSTQMPERKGYLFLGWATDKYADTVDYLPGDEYSTDADLKLYAVWTRLPGVYLVEYDANGGFNPPDTQVKIEEEALTLSEKVPEWDGGQRHEFLGWSTNKEATVAEYQPSDTFTADQDTVLYAVWKLKEGKVSITYYANGGTGAPAPQTAASGSTMTLSRLEPTRAGYVFAGWADSATASAADYQPGATITNLTTDLKLYAVWAKPADVVALIYDAKGGINAPETQLTLTGGKVRISTEKPYKEDYRFMGWTDVEAAESAKPEYAPGTEITLSADTILYAVWAKERTVGVINGTFNGIITGTINDAINGAGLPGVVGKFLVGETVTVVANTPEAGKQFTDWTVEEGNLVLSDDQKKATTFSFTVPDSEAGKPVSAIVLMANETYIPISPHNIFVVNGTANGKTLGTNYAGTALRIVADSVGGMLFDHWEVEGLNLTATQKVSPVFKTVMPDNDVKLKAVFVTAPIKPSWFTVVNGTLGDGTGTDFFDSYFAGATVTATADDEPWDTSGAVQKYTFDKWVVVEGDLELSKKEAKSKTLNVTMPDEDVTIEATYKTAAPGTGDSGRLFQWLGLATFCTLALIGGLYLAIHRKRKE